MFSGTGQIAGCEISPVDDDGALQFLDQPGLAYSGSRRINNDWKEPFAASLYCSSIILLLSGRPSWRQNYPVGESNLAMGNLDADLPERCSFPH